MLSFQSCVLLLRLLYPFIDGVLSQVYSNNHCFGRKWLSVEYILCVYSSFYSSPERECPIF